MTIISHFEKKQRMLRNSHDYSKRKNIDFESIIRNNKSKYRIYNLDKKTGELIFKEYEK